MKKKIDKINEENTFYNSSKLNINLENANFLNVIDL